MYWDSDLTPSAAPTQKHVTQYRNIIIPLDFYITFRTKRTREYNGFFSGDSINANIQKTAYYQSHNKKHN